MGSLLEEGRATRDEGERRRKGLAGNNSTAAAEQQYAAVVAIGWWLPFCLGNRPVVFLWESAGGGYFFFFDYTGGGYWTEESFSLRFLLVLYNGGPVMACGPRPRFLFAATRAPLSIPAPTSKSCFETWTRERELAIGQAQARRRKAN
jgi:hypothetical protein